MSLVRTTAIAAGSSGVALATVCGLLWLVPRWTDHMLHRLPARQAEAAAIRAAWTASRIEGELLRLEARIGPSDARLRAGRTFDEALIGASRAHPDPDRARTVGRLTSTMRQVSGLERGAVAVATLAWERDRQLEAWSRGADSDIVSDLYASLQPMSRLADVGAAGGLIGLVLSLWVSAAVMRRVDEWEGVGQSAPPLRLPPDLPLEDLAVAYEPVDDPSPPDLDPDAEEPVLAMADLGEVMNDVVAMLDSLSRLYGHILYADVGPELDEFVVDVELLHAVLRDLVEGPLRTALPGTVILRARREGRGAVVSILTRHSSAEPDVEGPRCGTVLAHDGVEALGGRLWWSADPGDGVRVALFVPDRRSSDGRVDGSVLV